MKRLCVIFLVVVGSGQGGWCAFKIGLNEGRSPISAISVASINHQGIVFSPAPGRSDFNRYKWTEFSAEGLKELQRVLPREKAFQQKRGIDKVEYLQLISDELKKIAPPKPAAPSPILIKPKPPPVELLQATSDFSDSIPKKPPETVKPMLPKKQLESEPETAPAFQLIRPAGNSLLPNHRPTNGGMFSVIFSPAGVFFGLIVMGFSVYAGGEIARFRNRPKSLVCAISALFPVIGPTVFLLLPDPAAKYADKMAEANDPFLLRKSGDSEPTEKEASVKIDDSKNKYTDAPNSLHFDLDHGEEETHLEANSQTPLAATTFLPHHTLNGSAANVMELYRTPEYLFDFAFFDQFFERFINAQPSDGQTLVLRTHDLEYTVHYISELAPTALTIIYPSGDEWLEDTIEYKRLEEVEVVCSKP